ncbi:cuticle protein AMP1A-like isoform X2 [Palaemon carinicauda]|uniref:cuticle protein AMP1A-like isoform X1 n=1 Tax=Palaemon carinicauda TaxID=392227 RepID=UPI0035B5AD69
MKITIIVTIIALAAAAPQYDYNAPPPPPPAPAPAYGAPSTRVSTFEVAPPVAILRDDRTHDEFGRFSVDFEAENGIVFSQSGSPDGPEGAVVKAGQYSYTAPDGTLVEVKYVADENGFQPQSDLLPVAPEFPHPIPQFVLDQIAFAAAEDAAAAREAASSRSNSYAPPPPAPSNTYGQPS